MGYSDRKGSLVIYLILLPFIALFISGFYKSVNRAEKQYPKLSSTLDYQDVLGENLPGFIDVKNIKKNVNLQKGHKKTSGIGWYRSSRDLFLG